MAKQKSLFTLLALVAILVSFATTRAFSHGCYWDNWTAGADAAWWNNNVPDEYALSAEQITTINSIRAKYSEKILPLQNELRALRMEQRGYAARADADIDKIKSYRKQIRKLEDKIDDLRLDARGKINKMLTSEQRQYFNNGNYGWWDAWQNWQHSGGHGRMNSGRMGRMMNMNGGRCW